MAGNFQCSVIGCRETFRRVGAANESVGQRWRRYAKNPVNKVFWRRLQHLGERPGRGLPTAGAEPSGRRGVSAAIMRPLTARMLRRFYEDRVTKNQGECWLNIKIRVHSAVLAALNR